MDIIKQSLCLHCLHWCRDRRWCCVSVQRECICSFLGYDLG